MHGIVNRGLQTYVSSIFSPEIWEDVCTDAGLKFFNFETMLTYDDSVTDRIIDATSTALNRTRSEILEDFGTFVVAEKELSVVRRLLRFGGDDFVEFLHSLEDVHGLTRVAMPDLAVPEFELERTGDDQFCLSYSFDKPGFGPVFLGLLRAMADDYGALVVIEHKDRCPLDETCECFEISILHHGWPEAAETAGIQVGKEPH